MITEKEVPYETMKNLVKRNETCAECGSNLTVAWGGSYGFTGYILRCASDIKHTGIARSAKLNRMDTPDDYQIGNMQRTRRKALAKQIGEEKANQLAIYAGKGQLTIPEAKEIILTIWPGAPEVEVKKAAIVCQIYGLNPLMKHLYLIPFNTKVGDKWEKSFVMVLGIKASRIIARRKGEYAYLDDTPRIMNEAEQVKIFGEVDKDNICAITRLNDRKGNSAIGIGKWPKTKEVQGGDKGNSKLNMAMIRSERQALERLFPDSMPSDAPDVIDERYQDLPDGRQVETSTGEIIEPTPSVEGELVSESKEEQSPTQNAALISPDQEADLRKIVKESGRTLTDVAGYIKDTLKWEGIKNLADLKVYQYEQLKQHYIEVSK